MSRERGWRRGPTLSGCKTGYNHQLQQIAANGCIVRLQRDEYRVALVLLLWREQWEERHQGQLRLCLPLWKLQALAGLVTLRRAYWAICHARRELARCGLAVICRPGRGYAIASVQDYVGMFDG